MCSHPESCRECGFTQYALERILDKFDIDEEELWEDFKKIYCINNGCKSNCSHTYENNSFECIGCGRKNCQHSVCKRCKDDHCFKCAVINKCRLCGVEGCSWCVFKCEKKKECQLHLCGTCIDTCIEANNYPDNSDCEHIF